MFWASQTRSGLSSTFHSASVAADTTTTGGLLSSRGACVCDWKWVSRQKLAHQMTFLRKGCSSASIFSAGRVGLVSRTYDAGVEGDLIRGRGFRSQRFKREAAIARRKTAPIVQAFADIFKWRFDMTMVRELEMRLHAMPAQPL
jgi:hypothetical protein